MRYTTIQLKHCIYLADVSAALHSHIYKTRSVTDNAHGYANGALFTTNVHAHFVRTVSTSGYLFGATEESQRVRAGDREP